MRCRGLAIVASMAITSGASAQDREARPWSLRAVMGVGAATLTTPLLPLALRNSARAATTAGVEVAHRHGDRMSLSAGLLHAVRGAEGDFADFRTTWLDLPLLAHVRVFREPRFAVALAAGPVVSWSLSGRALVDDGTPVRVALPMRARELSGMVALEAALSWRVPVTGRLTWQQGATAVTRVHDAKSKTIGAQLVVTAARW